MNIRIQKLKGVVLIAANLVSSLEYILVIDRNRGTLLLVNLVETFLLRHFCYKKLEILLKKVFLYSIRETAFLRKAKVLHCS